MATKKKDEKIVIWFSGSKKFKQFLVDRIYELLQDEDVFEDVARKGCEFRLETSIKPTGADEGV